MIEKLNKNELNYESRKNIFRKKFTSGTISDRKTRNCIDKGKLLKKLSQEGSSHTSWLLYLYKKLNWLDQQYKEKYQW